MRARPHYERISSHLTTELGRLIPPLLGLIFVLFFFLSPPLARFVSPPPSVISFYVPFPFLDVRLVSSGLLCFLVLFISIFFIAICEFSYFFILLLVSYFLILASFPCLLSFITYSPIFFLPSPVF